VGKRTVAVFEAMLQCRRRFGAEAVGAYVVNGVNGADDVLAAMLLAQWAEAYDKRNSELAIDFAPLFDSVEALSRAGDAMHDLLAEPVYRRHLDSRGRRQAVLVGYSESAKQVGPCAARFAAYRAQGALASALAAAGEEHVVCHVRGGSIPRGGGRIDDMIAAMPPSTVNGWLRLTEQGEALNQHYGLGPIALRSLERAFGVLSQVTAAGRRGGRARRDRARGRSAPRAGERRALSRARLGRAGFPRLVPCGDTDRCHRAHAGGRSACGAPGLRGSERAAGVALGVRVDAEPRDAAGLVWRGQRPARCGGRLRVACGPRGGPRLGLPARPHRCDRGDAGAQ
jgi:phosphoenolpyruvate carboxylase